MNKFLFIVLLLIGQQAISQQSIVKINPLALSFKTVSMGYEYTLNEKTSANLFVNIARLGVESEFEGIEELAGTEGVSSVDFNVIGFLPEYRFYPGKKKEAPRGFFVAPYLNLTFGKLKGEATAATLTASAQVNSSLIGAGAIIGGHWLIKDVFSLELFFGGSYNRIGVDNIKVRFEDLSTANIKLGFKGNIPLPRIGLAAGIAF